MTKRQRRPPIPKALQQRLLYESQYVCCICQRHGVQIHHIDGDNSNNSETNLIVLCLEHHGEAHTIRSLGKNLDASGLRHAKKKWTNQVRESRIRIATVGGQKKMVGSAFLLAGIAWGYINHKRVVQIVDPRSFEGSDATLYQTCLRRGLVDDRGIIISPHGRKTNSSFVRGSIYDRFDFGDDHRVHAMYSTMVDHIGRSTNVVHIEREVWTKARLQALLKPGAVLFLERAFYFKNVSSTANNEHRRARYFKRGIEVEFFVDTIDMFGTTSMTVSFVGHQSASALLQLKSMGVSEEGKLRLNCTPIALGVGFQPSAGRLDNRMLDLI